MPSNEVLVDIKERVATITLNRPDVLNAVHREMFEEIRAAALELDDDPEVGAIILTGAGRGFCSGVDVSGHDFGASADRTPTVYAYEGGPVGIYNIRKPTIAAVGGPAVGVGLGMALACDLRIASDDARFTTGLARVGLPSVDGLGLDAAAPGGRGQGPGAHLHRRDDRRQGGGAHRPRELRRAA